MVGNLNLSQCWPWPSQVMSLWKKNLKKFRRCQKLWPPVLWGGVSMYLKTEQGCYTESPMMPNLNLSAYSERPPKVTMNRKKILKKFLRSQELWRTENEVQTICTHTIQMQHVIRAVLSSRPIVDSQYFMTTGRDGFTVCYQTANGTRSIVMGHRSTVTDRSVVQSYVVSLFLQEIKYSS